jgi:hypothetical protein
MKYRISQPKWPTRSQRLGFLFLSGAAPAFFRVRV